VGLSASRKISESAERISISISQTEFTKRPLSSHTQAILGTLERSSEDRFKPLTNKLALLLLSVG